MLTARAPLPSVTSRHLTERAGPRMSPHRTPCRRVESLLGAASVLLVALLVFALLGGSSPAAARVPEILAFGDSLTAGLGLPADAAFPSRLEIGRASCRERV